MDWPVTLTHDRVTYYWTGKTGTNIATGQPAAEYARHDERRGARVWLLADGTVVPE